MSALRRGIEKESLRVSENGYLAQTPHPAMLGSSLTHPHITTDFSEAQIELITGIHPSAESCLHELDEIHRYVVGHIGDELLWAASMPCMLSSDADVPVGRYGTSNVGTAKTVYRLGLGHRYGRLMQTISGIHYNFSLPEAAWPLLAECDEWTRPLLDYQTDSYLALIRNFRRYSWLLHYLFGASPAVCRTFLKNRTHRLEPLDAGTLHAPFGTSLRMGRLGYQGQAQASLHLSYNSLESYAVTMNDALTRPYPPYESLGVKRDGEYMQLNTSLLQIENEFYSPIRPKRRIRSGERPLRALGERGVEYVEVRALDLDPFMRVGIDEETMHFLDAFLLFCLFEDSPHDTQDESAEQSHNQLLVVEEGRRPGLALVRAGKELSFEAWSRELIDRIVPIAELLDTATATRKHMEALAAQRDKMDDADRTPSARILARLKDERIPFFRFAMNQSLAHREYFLAHPLSDEREEELRAVSEASHEEQKRIEAADVQSFDEYIETYLSQDLLVPQSREQHAS
jgi:glutamate--cysteine ligase